MSGLLNNSLFLSTAAAAGGYQIERSLRFNSSDSGFCSRSVPTAGSLTTWTWAGWAKRSSFDTTNNLFAVYPGSNFGNIRFANQNIDFGEYTGGSYSGRKITTAVFRDPSAWYHIVATWDTTNGTAADRMRLYVNGVRVDAFSTSTDPGPSATSVINTAVTHRIGTFEGSTEFFNGYLADIHFIDGQALTPSSFTEVSATTGQLIPLAYTGTYGTNGIQLKFADNSAATAATLGADTSGNGNNWTPNNLSVTAGAGNDSLVDTPTSYGTPDTGVGNEVRGNYCTLNPLDKATTGGALSNGNLDYAATVASWDMVRATFGISSGKWYWEVSVNSTTYGITGIAQASVDLNNNFFDRGICYGYNAQNGYKYQGSPFAALAYGATWNGSGDICGVAFNSDAGTLTFYKNGVSQGVAYTGLTGTFFPAHTSYPTGSATFNFGQRAFAYPLSGFKALCDTNLGAPLVAKPNTLMDVITYTGTGAIQTLPNANSTPSTPLAFSPDFVWLKDRSGGGNHNLYDSVRGATLLLYSNLTLGEGTSSGLTAFTSDGFTLGASQSSDGNLTGRATVAWAWDAGTSTVSNTAGSITSQVRANVSAGFSVVTYTGVAGNQSFGHGLGVKPKLIMIKNRSNSANWFVMVDIGTTYYKYGHLNTTDAFADATAQPVTSTTVTLGNNNAWFGANGDNYVAYCFAPVDGYFSFGSYVGNYSADGPFVYTGFRSRFVMIKCSSTGGFDWRIFDTSRSDANGANVVNYKLYPNSSAQENDSSLDNANSNNIDILSNGFKLRTANGATNDPQTYIYAAFAENPFQYARAR